MCRICGKFICPPPCPSYDGESAERGKKIAVCTACECSICEYDEIRFKYGFPYCLDCFNEIREDTTQNLGI